MADIDPHVAPWAVVFAGIRQQVEEDLQQSARIRHDTDAELGPRSLCKFDVAGSGQWLCKRDRFVEDGRDIAAHVHDVETPGLDEG